MNLRNLSLASALLLLVCQLGFSQSSVDRTVVLNALAKAQATNHPVPVVSAASAQGAARPLVWVNGKIFAKGAFTTSKKPAVVPSEPSFCDYNSGSFEIFCPKGVETAYGVNSIIGANGGAGMTVAIVDYFSYSLAESSLAQFDSDMGLPACTSASHCFTSIDISGGNDGTGTGWDVESMLDIEYVHAMAPNAHIVYIQANPYTSDGTDANSVGALGCPASPYCPAGVVTPPAVAVSNSWTFNTGETWAYLDPLWNLGTPLLFASGDDGAYPPAVIGYPCSSTNVTCVGGTSLYTTPSLVRTSEAAWSGGGGGCSQVEAMPAWQGANGSSVCYPYRATPDVSAIADPDTGVAIYIGGAYAGYYYGVGGTSLATPVTSGLVADIDTARASFGKSKINFLDAPVYQAAASNYGYFFYDVTTGSNGFAAGPQYDLATGLGNLTGKDAANRFFGLP